MDRRTAIKQLSILGGAILAAPSCTFSSERVSVALNNLDISARQEHLLADIADTIIPPTEKPGAKSLNVHHFVLVMIDDCRNETDRQLFADGLKTIDRLANHYHDSAFSACTPSQREHILTGIMEEDQDFRSQLGSEYDRFREFAFMVKQYTIQGYLQSQYVMTEISPYVMAPGYFDGCVPVEQQG